MKKLALLLAIMIMILALTACSGSGDTEPTAAPTIAPTVATTTAPPVTAAPEPTTAPTTETPPTTEMPTFSSSEGINEGATMPTDPETGENIPMEESTMNENGEKVMSGVVTGLGGITVVIDRGDGQEFEFSYSAANITGAELIDGSYVTITYTGDITGDSLGNAIAITVG